MKLISLNTSLPRRVEWHGSLVSTGIYKQPVQGRVTLRRLNLDGDQQADLTVHGGPFKAIYAYPVEHYEYWRKQLPGKELPPGMFGENLTTEGLLEDAVCLGDRFAVGSAEIVVTQPRIPCYKLGIKFESDGMVKRFFDSRKTGFYFSVSQKGEVGAGDEISLVARDPIGFPVAEIFRLYAVKTWGDSDIAAIQRALQVNALPESWKEWFRERLRDRTAEQ